MRQTPGRRSRGLTLAVPLLRGAFQWLFGILFALSLIALFFLLNALQLTAPDTAQRVLRQALADLTEVDALLSSIQADLAEAARSGQGPTVTAPHFPIPVEIPRDEAEKLSAAELRSRLLGQGAKAIYEDGMSAFAQGDPEAKQDIEIFSPQGWTTLMVGGEQIGRASCRERVFSTV